MYSYLEGEMKRGIEMIDWLRREGSCQTGGWGQWMGNSVVRFGISGQWCSQIWNETERKRDTGFRERVVTVQLTSTVYMTFK